LKRVNNNNIKNDWCLETVDRRLTKMYKQEIKVMDCTVRDGGLMNKWQFSDEFV